MITEKQRQERRKYLGSSEGEDIVQDFLEPVIVSKGAQPDDDTD